MGGKGRGGDGVAASDAVSRRHHGGHLTFTHKKTCIKESLREKLYAYICQILLTAY